MADLTRFLKQASQTWDEAVKEAESSSFDNPADGIYIVLLSGAEAKESKAGKLQIVWTWTILDGELQGKTKTEFMGLEYEWSLASLARRFRDLGRNAADEDINQLEEILKEEVEKQKKFQIQLKTKPNSDFQNLYIRRQMSDDWSPDDSLGSLGDDGYGSTDHLDDDSNSSDLEDESGSEEESEPLEIGSLVGFIEKGKTLEGTVTSINEKTSEVTISSGNKKYLRQAEEIWIIKEGQDGTDEA